MGWDCLALLDFHGYIQGYFSDGMYQNTAPKVISQDDRNWNSVPESLFLASVQLTPPPTFQPNFVSLCIPELFLKKNSTGYIIPHF
jgi:hypothetical protein